MASSVRDSVVPLVVYGCYIFSRFLFHLLIHSNFIALVGFFFFFLPISMLVLLGLFFILLIILCIF